MEKKFLKKVPVFWKEVPIVILNRYTAFGMLGIDHPFKGDPPYLSIFEGYFRQFYIDKAREEISLSVGYLTQNDMAEILDKIEKSGFWRIPARLPSEGKEVLDGDYRKIFVNCYWLQRKTKEIVYHYGTPRTDEEVSFMKLFDEIEKLANKKPQTSIIYEKRGKRFFN